MKTVFTPLGQFEEFLQGDMGKKSIFGLSYYIREMEKEFERVRKAIPFELTEEAKQKYIDFDHINIDFKKFISESGLLVSFDWENWLEGNEVLEGVRPMSKLNQVKVFKMLTLIFKKDVDDHGYFDHHLKNGNILLMFKNLPEYSEQQS
jgi:hypothetical protein